jgi:hypothetical protein
MSKAENLEGKQSRIGSRISHNMAHAQEKFTTAKMLS